MAWLTPHQSILPLSYGIDIKDYKKLPQMSKSEIKEDINEWLSDLVDMWGEIKGIWLSGAVGVTAVTETYPRVHTNTDFAVVIDKKGTLENMVETAKEHSLFLFSREKSVKNGFHDPDKHETYVVATPTAVNKNRETNKNYMFCKVDSYGQIIPLNRIRNRIRIYPHIFNEKDDTYLSIEDGLKIPTEWLGYQRKQGRVIKTSIDHKKQVLTADIRYMAEIHKKLRFGLFKSAKRKQKHMFEFERIKNYLSEHPEYLRFKQINA